MIPFILAAVGGYLIGDSFGKEINSKIPKFADGGDVDARKTYLYIGKKYDGYYVMVSVYNQPNLGGQILESGFTTATEAMDFAIDKMYQFRLSKNHVGFADDEAKNGFHSERLKNYEVVKDVHTDAEGVSYNQLKHKK